MVWYFAKLHLCGRSTGVNWNNIKSEQDLLCVILMLTPGHLSTSTKFQLSFRRTILHRIRGGTQPGPNRPGQPKLRSTSTRLSDLCWSARALARCDGTHSANFNEKVHKPQSKTYHRIDANATYAHILWIWILLSVHCDFLGSECF